MNRCHPLPAAPSRHRAWLTASLFGLGALLYAWPPVTAHAQNAQEVVKIRAFPPQALRGTLVVTSPPDIAIDGRAERLSPGSRIRDLKNIPIMSGALVGRELVVNYTRESNGLVHEVWVLTEAEIAEKRPKAQAARNFLFGSEANAPKRDDGKTPYNQLPGYGTSTR